VTTDTELEAWRQEWRHQTEPLPELKKRIKRQNLSMVVAVITICACLALSTVEALRTRSSFMAGVAAGIGFASLLFGGYAWLVRRGAWRPTAQTTLAYAELSYKRAIAKARTLRFSFYFLLIATGLLTAFVAWNWKNFHARDGVIVAAMMVEMFFLRHYERRKRREIEETRKLLDDLKK
jgi:hypothetical protein